MSFELRCMQERTRYVRKGVDVRRMSLVEKVKVVDIERVSARFGRSESESSREVESPCGHLRWSRDSRLGA
jgi:hypothetical protein